MSLLSTEQAELMGVMDSSPDPYLVIRRYPKSKPYFILEGEEVKSMNSWSVDAVLGLWNMGWLKMECHLGEKGRQEVRWSLTVMGVRSFNIIRGDK